jgi:hypothetical protein
MSMDEATRRAASFVRMYLRETDASLETALAQLADIPMLEGYDLEAVKADLWT